ncbi:MAG: nitroreductase family deazaflavin-dependent oxidoreductase [Anaerolineae bacterium]
MTHDSKSMMPYPGGGLLRWLFRAPIAAWRLGLGRLFGHIFVLITTWGRSSGKPRRALTEYLPLKGKLYVACAYGPQADWYKNIVADPHVTVQTWQGPESMIASRVTDDDELRAVYHGFKRRSWPVMRWYLSSVGIDPQDPDDYVAKKERVYIFRFDPTAEPTPPPLEADLVWVWPLTLVGLLLVLLFRHLIKRSDE